MARATCILGRTGIDLDRPLKAYFPENFRDTIGGFLDADSFKESPRIYQEPA